MCLRFVCTSKRILTATVLRELKVLASSLSTVRPPLFSMQSRMRSAAASITSRSFPKIWWKSSMPEKIRLRFSVNGEKREVETYPMARLLDVLREDLHLTGTKEGCGEGECGACSVIVDGEVVDSCLVAVAQVEGSKVITVEGLADGGRLTALQQAFIEHGAAQCGICTPGMLLAAHVLLQQPKRLSAADVREGLGGNLANASPAGDTLPVLLAYDAVVLTDRRSIAIDKFFTGYRKTALQSDELITAVRFPLGRQVEFRKVGTRAAQAISKIVMAVSRSPARVAVGSVAEVPLRARRAEAALERGDVEGAVAAVADEIRPIDDVRSTAVYRRTVTQNVLRELLSIRQQF